MGKVILIGLGVCCFLGLLIVFPYFCIGVLIAAFCLWRGWFIAAAVFFLLAIVFQAMLGKNHLDEGPVGGFEDVDPAGHDRPDIVDLAIGYTIYDHIKNKDDKD